MTLSQRFWSKVKIEGLFSCWEWQAGKHSMGYGVFKFDGRCVLAHRLSFFLAHGKGPKGVIDHLCRNKACVNPGHLDDVTQRENTVRGKTSRLKNGKTSRYPGVSRSRGKWAAQVRIDGGSNKFLGRFKTEEEAYAVYLKEIER